MKGSPLNTFTTFRAAVGRLLPRAGTNARKVILHWQGDERPSRSGQKADPAEARREWYNRVRRRRVHKGYKVVRSRQESPPRRPSRWGCSAR